MRSLRRAVFALTLVVAAVLPGCGGSGDALAPATGPARSPALEATPAGRVVSVGGRPEGLAFDRGTGLLSVRLSNPDRIALVDGRSGRTVRRVPRPVSSPEQRRALNVPVAPGGSAVTAEGDRFAVLARRQRALELFDTRTRHSLGRIHVGIGPTHVIARGAWLFVVDTRGNGLIEVSTEPLRVHLRMQLTGAPYGIALDPVSNHFWVTLTALNRVAEVTGHRVLRSFPTVRQPDSVAVDPATGRVFVAGRKAGTLQLLDPPPHGD